MRRMAVSQAGALLELRETSMHPIAVWKIVDSVRLRVNQGDCPTEPPHSRETLEEVVLELSAQVQRLQIALDPDEEPSAGGCFP